MRAAMSYVRTQLSFKSKRRIELLIYNPFQRRIELLIYNPFQTIISQSPQFHKSLRLAVRDDNSGCIFHFTNNFTLQTLYKQEKAKCAVGVQLARSIVNGLVHELEELNLFCLAKLLCY